MKTIKFLETLANNPHYYPNLHNLINQQPEEIKEAFANNNPHLLSKVLSNGNLLPHITKVVSK